MTNASYDIEDYRDIELLNMYRERKASGYSEEAIMESIHAKGRDNARTPMQWEDGQEAGFTSGTPWIKVNPNYQYINAKAALADEHSIFHYYRNLIALRKQYDIFWNGHYEPIMEEHESVFAYIRRNGRKSLLMVANFYGEEILYTIPEEFSRGEVLIHNYKDLEAGKLRPYEAMLLYSEE